MAGGGDPRESATESKPPALRVRVKGCGKSAPRRWQQGRHGKPHREQNQIGMGGARATCARAGFPGLYPGWLLEVSGNRHPR